MDSSLTEDCRKLEWSGRLCALLLNDGTDVMRWFLMENLPRKRECEANLQEMLKHNRELFIDLCDQRPPVINQEMFGILFREDREEVDFADLEIYLLYVLIRYLCNIKHPSWKWWDEAPLPYQTAPVFDVIRLFRAKQDMKEMVHRYEITKKQFTHKWTYLTSLLDRLRSYAISSRRWYDDVMKKRDETNVEKTYTNLLNIMRWQTLDLKQRDKIYLNLKENRDHVIKDNQKQTQDQTWSDFISQFGQRKDTLGISKLDLPKPDKPKHSVMPHKRHNASFQIIENNEGNLTFITESNGQTEVKPTEHSRRCVPRKHDSRPADESVLKPEEKEILQQITNNVFIKELDCDEEICSLEESIRKLYIHGNDTVFPFPSERRYRLHMDKVVFNVAQILFEEKLNKFPGGDIPVFKPKQRPLSSWYEFFHSDTPVRILLTGEWSSGKTTLMRKITYDWATRNDTNLDCYRFVFYIDLSMIEPRRPYTSLSECIAEQCANDASLAEIELLFDSSDGDGILLLFDGAERMPDANTDVMSELSDVISGLRWSHSSVILTTIYSQVDTDSYALRWYQNIKYFITRSQKPWRTFSVMGFSTQDVITHTRDFYRWAVGEPRYNATARECLTLCRKYQRDVYRGIISSPTITFLLCSQWLSISDRWSSSGRKVVQEETLSGLMEWYFEDFEFSNEHARFWDEVLDRTLNANSGHIYKLSSRSLRENMVRRGYVYLTCDQEDRIRFIHVLFEDFCAARWLCSTRYDERNWKKIMDRYVSSLASAVRLRHFILFCSSFNKGFSAITICSISNLIQEQLLLKNSDLPPTNLVEAAKHLTLQCFYEIKSVSRDSFLSAVDSEDIDAVNNKDGSTLSLRHMSSISQTSKRAALFLTSQCHPTLTSSGTVFPFLDGAGFWIVSVHLSNMVGKQMKFIVALLRNLPFLEKLKLDDVRDVEDCHLANLCEGLKHGDDVRSALHILSLTIHSVSSFDACRISTYRSIGELLQYLPYLELLQLSIPTSKLFFSLFTPNSQVVVPLTVIDLSHTGLNAEQCRCLSSLLPRLIFVEELVLANNPLADGFESICTAIRHFRNLKILNISRACLTTSSSYATSDALRSINIRQTLKHFDASGNYIQDADAISGIAKAIEQLQHLEYLDLSDNRLGNNAACVLAKSLSKQKKIDTLRLNSTQMGATALASLKENLWYCPSLRVLSIAGNFFDANILGFMACPQSLAGTPTSEGGFHFLEELNLSGISGKVYTTVNSRSIKRFLESVKTYRSIKRIILLHMKIKTPDLVLLLQTFEKHASLKELRLSAKLLDLSKTQIQSWSCLKVC